jgi:hypothetical protein
VADETAIDTTDTVYLCGFRGEQLLTSCEGPRGADGPALTPYPQVVAVQQGIYRAAPLPRFDPTELCEELFQPWVNRNDRELMQDNVLVAHVRLALILQSWRRAIDPPKDSDVAPDISIYQIMEFNDRLDRWMSDLERVGIPSEHRDYLAPIWLYARLIINLAGANVPHVESSNLFCGNAYRAARSMVDVFNGPRLLEMMPLLPPFYIEVGVRARGDDGVFIAN